MNSVSEGASGLSQSRAPVYEALQEYKSLRIVPFDVPGHKQGRGNPELTEFLGKDCLAVDVNSMKLLDNLCHPVSVIREAEDLAAAAFGAAHAFFIVNGTTAAVQAMAVSVASAGRQTSRFGMMRIDGMCSTGWCVGPSSPRPMESWVYTMIWRCFISAAMRMPLRA